MIINSQVGEFLDTKRKTAFDENELTPVVSLRLGELNKLCRKKGIDTLEQNATRAAVAKFGIGE